MQDLALAAAPLLLLLGSALLLPGLSPDRPLPRLLGAVLVAALMLRYLAWRATETLPPLAWSAEAAIAWGFFGLELLSCTAGLLLLHVLSRTCNRSAEADAHPVEGIPGGAPLIDVLIPTYNEGREILTRSIVGAVAQDYPRFRVWVLDDGRRPWLRALAEAHGAHYLTRADNKHGKAGNMNAALRHLLALEERAEAIAVLDADFIATPRFLRRAAALLHDPEVGCVQTPQHFFNPDPIQLNLRGLSVLGDEQRFFFDTILASKDAHGTAFSCGTSGLVRLAALERIGLFPTESVTEDMLLSVKLKGLGWSTVYLNEPLTVGLAPEGLQEYLTQRGRWCLGAMQIARTRWGPFGAGPMPWRMRLHTLDSVLFWGFSTLMRLACLLVPILYWWFGIMVARTDMRGILDNLIPYWLASSFYLGWVSRGASLPLMADAMGLLVTREALLGTAIGLFGRRDQTFKVTAKGTRRDRAVMQWGIAWPWAVLLALTAGGIAWRFLLGPMPHTSPELEAANLFWSLLNIATLAITMLICVDQPRRRRQERFDADEPATLRLPGVEAHAVRLRDLSVTGCRVEGGPAGLAAGRRLTLRLSGVGDVSAEIRRVSGTTLHLAFQVSTGVEAALIRKIFSGRYVRSVTSTRPQDLLRVLAQRAFG
ncbi:glycosyltransferase [Roseicella aquatilis]|uniref:Glycosyltransferase n=1 Tax=Roseicella aquatilis TaxID=2527868 RepID=A0A4R4DA99_9PROT|nr:glycosyltransferase [Roseicella aquatilis]TCZ56692.1 glycosyltransferase [Roseicella aquatilis]